MKYTYITLITIVFLFTQCKQEKARKEDFVSQIIPVKVEPVRAFTDQTIVSSSGLINTQNVQKYAFKIGGIIQSINVDEGDYFRKGDLLASLDLEEINAQLNQAKLARDKAERDFNRAENLYKDSIATLENYQDAQTQLLVAQETIDQIEFNIKHARIYATSSGFVNQKMFQVGEVVGPGSPLIIANDASRNSGWILETGVSASEWADIQKGDQCQLSIDAYPEQTFQGIVSRKSKLADPISGSFTTEILISNSQKPLAIGMYATAEIKTNKTSNYVLISNSALAEANGRNGFVYMPKGSSQVVKRGIRISGIEKEGIRVISGLQENDTVIVSNSAFLNESSIINIIH